MDWSAQVQGVLDWGSYCGLDTSASDTYPQQGNDFPQTPSWSRTRRKRVYPNRVDGKYPCAECDKAFLSHGARWNHVKAIHDKATYHCTYGSGVGGHVGNVYPTQSFGRAGDPNSLQFPYAMPSNSNQVRFTYPKAVEGKFPCPMCDKVYSDSGNRSRHVGAVHKKQTFFCDCGVHGSDKGYDFSEFVQSGRGMHDSSQESYHWPTGRGSSLTSTPLEAGGGHSCPQCGKTFANMGSRWHHIAAVHNKQTYACVCGNKYNYSYNLKRHKKRCPVFNTHGLDSFMESFQGKGTCFQPSWPDSVRSRQSISNRVYPGPVNGKYPCPECDKTFAGYGSRWNHVKAVHDKVVHICICGRTYSNGFNLKRHMRNCSLCVPTG
ncbi:zinc finger protein 16-like [Haliotis cracherodii]|uniref:zinc finger protein 16-like n=1 Tax=Haliotis cracherodii TaxID=6455 RepID=UPI0039ED5F05